jgi:hypothetical protein
MLKSVLRRAYRVALLPLVSERVYREPQAVGYASSLRAPLVGVVAFRRLDGRFLYRETVRRGR